VFLTQEVAGEAGFEDLLAITQVKMPVTAKLEMARNYWDEMGRGRETAMHGPLLERLATYLEIDEQLGHVVPEAVALGNAMLALARSRRYCFQSIGALGVIEMTAPTRAGFVDAGLKRLGIPTKVRVYFTLHAGLDINHSECWNREVLRSLSPRIRAAPMRSEKGRCSGYGMGRDASSVIAVTSVSMRSTARQRSTTGARDRCVS
jgi:hypothetical protein